MARLGGPAEAGWLLEEVAGASLATLLAGGRPDPGAGEVEALERLVQRRLAGEPLQHVLSTWSFRRLELRVDGRALVPRPETEVVAGHALAALAAARQGRNEALVAVDLGTGSGAIACALVTEDPDVSVVAVDRSAAALELAGENRARLLPFEADRLELRLGSWYEPLGDLAGSVALVVSNPPYLAAHELPGLDPVVRDFDPPEALVAGKTGLEAIEAVLGGAPELLRPGGSLVLELAPHQGQAARALALGAGASFAALHLDLAGRTRCLVATW